MKLKKLTETTIRLTHLEIQKDSSKKEFKTDENEMNTSSNKNNTDDAKEIYDAQLKTLMNSSLVTSNDFDLDSSIDLDSSS